jgi:hypothetical protein
MAAEDWKGHERRDGARVRLISRGKWLVPVGGPVREAITHCPCCGQSFETMAQAQRAVDCLYRCEAPSA